MNTSNKLKNKNEIIFSSDSANETKNIGRRFSLNLAAGEAVFLEGEVGAGKTTFIQGLTAELGVKENARSSSFIVVNEYKGKRIKRIFHIDLYRLSPGNIENLGLDEYFAKDSLALVEWPQNLGSTSIKPDWLVKINYLKDNRREIIIKKAK